MEGVGLTGIEDDVSVGADGETQVRDKRYARASMFGLAFAAIFSIFASTLSGIGLTATVAVALVGLAYAIGIRSPTGAWLVTASALAPWLFVRDNTWLSISIVCTALLVIALASLAAATEQRIDDLSLGATLRRGPRPDVVDSLGSSERAIFAVVRGVLVATPIVAVFWMLLASADDVFAEIANPSIIPVARGVLFVVALPVFLVLCRFAMAGRASLPGPSRRRFGVVESSIVLGAVSLLFSVFIALRLATLGQELSDAAWRGEVRSGFFQLLWVAALTVLLVLAIRQVAGTPRLSGRLRTLALLTIGLAGVIDVLALQRIGEYVDRTFLSLSEDATPVLVENIDVLRPMPNDRYVRVVNHLCTRSQEDSWRDAHLSRQSAREATAELCASR